MWMCTRECLNENEAWVWAEWTDVEDEASTSVKHGKLETGKHVQSVQFAVYSIQYVQCTVYVSETE